MLESIGVANPVIPDDKNPQPGYFQETTVKILGLATPVRPNSWVWQ